MMDMVERVARAIYEGRNGPKCEPWAHKPKGHQDPYRADARAAIEAMREPTDEMTMAFIFTMKAGDFESAHNAMIDAALSRNQSGG